MRQYQDVWNEYNRVYSASDGAGKRRGVPYDAPRLISLCEEMQEILSPYPAHHAALWAQRAALHRAGRHGDVFTA